MIIPIENTDRQTFKFHFHSSVPERLSELEQSVFEDPGGLMLSSIVFLIGGKYVGMAEKIEEALKRQEKCFISIPDISKYEIPTEYEIQLAESFGDIHDSELPKDGLQLLVAVPISVYDSLFIHSLITLVNF